MAMARAAAAAHLANQTYTLAKGVVAQSEFANIMHSIWQCTDDSPNVSQPLLEEVAEHLNGIFDRMRGLFLREISRVPWIGGWMGEWLCWNYTVSAHILNHSMQDLTPPEDQIFRIFWGMIDPGYCLSRLSGLGGSSLLTTRNRLGSDPKL